MCAERENVAEVYTPPAPFIRQVLLHRKYRPNLVLWGYVKGLLQQGRYLSAAPNFSLVHIAFACVTKI